MDTRQNTLSEEEIITQATDVAGSDDEVTDLLSALDTFYLHGSADDQTGNVEAPDGHVFRVHRWLVRTDNYGFKNIETFDTEAEAISAMIKESEAYCLWAGDDQ